MMFIAGVSGKRYDSIISRREYVRIDETSYEALSRTGSRLTMMCLIAFVIRLPYFMLHAFALDIVKNLSNGCEFERR
jgi:hypothetical protein